MNKIKLEASYFFELDGKRTFGFVIDIQSNDQIPVFAEPLFVQMIVMFQRFIGIKSSIFSSVAVTI